MGFRNGEIRIKSIRILLKSGRELISNVRKSFEGSNGFLYREFNSNINYLGACGLRRFIPSPLL